MLSILVVNWNTRELLRKCLASTEVHAPGEDFEVIVVDNASTDGSADMVESEFPGARLIRSAKNTGYAKGNNLAFAEAQGDFLLTLNPDTEFVDDSLDRALHILRVSPEVGCIGARQVATDGSTQPSIRGFPTLLGIAGDLTGLGRRLPGGRLDSYRLSAFDYDQEQLAPQPMGTFLMFRREALEELARATSRDTDTRQAAISAQRRNAEAPQGHEAPPPLAPFDESFPIFFNEVDLLYRLKQKGWTTLYAPSVRILHHGGESTRQVRKSMIWESHRSLVRFLRKHQRSPLAAIGITLLVPIIYAAAFVRAKGTHAGFQA